MRRNLVSLAAVTLGLSVAGVIAVSFAQDGKPGPVLPPPSLFDEPQSDVRAVDSVSGTPPTAVVKAKPAPASVKAETAAPVTIQEDAEVEPPAKRVWWKPWTWFAGRSKPVAAPVEREPVATEPMPSKTAQSGRAADGYAFDSPSKIIRSGMGTCLKTGMWDGSAGGSECGDNVASQDSRPMAIDTGKQGDANESKSAGGDRPATPQAAEPAPVVVSALAPEREIANKPLGENGQFETMQVDSAAQGSDGKGMGDKSAAQSSGKDAPSKGAISPSNLDKPLSMSAEALFAFKSSKLLWGGKQQLDKVAAQLVDGDFQTVRVVGHTDRVGAPDRNKRLSLKRAKAVKEYLVLKGVEPDRIIVEGRGASDPITAPRQCERLSTTARRACEAPDRRVEIVVTRALAKKKQDSHVGG